MTQTGCQASRRCAERSCSIDIFAGLFATPPEYSRKKAFAIWAGLADNTRQRTKARSSATWPKPVPHHQVWIYL
jgi:hypothetical protein